MSLYRIYSGYIMATTIQLQPETREMLRAVGGKGETYDEIIRELLGVYEARLAELKRRLEDPDENYIPLEEIKKERRSKSRGRSSPPRRKAGVR